MTWNVSLTSNVTDYGTLAVGISNSMPLLMPLILFFEYALILLVGMGIQSRKIGTGNALMWSTIAGFATTLTAIIWTGVNATIQGIEMTMVNYGTIGICLAVTGISALAFFLSEDVA